ncbi:MAG: hypothetical protein QM820_53810 [Minicystis sp.]
MNRRTSIVRRLSSVLSKPAALLGILVAGATLSGAGCAADPQEEPGQEERAGEAPQAWDTASATSEAHSTHLWIVNRAIDILAKHADIDAEMQGLPIALLLSEINDPACRAQWQQGLYDADCIDQFNDGGRCDNPLLSDDGAWKSHFFDPDTGKNYEGETSPTARTQASKFLSLFFALSSLGDPLMPMACYNLGLSLHYMTDATQPMHAVNFTALSWPMNFHGNFEAYAEAHQNQYALSDWLGFPAATETADEILVQAASHAKTRWNHVLDLISCERPGGYAIPFDDGCWLDAPDLSNTLGGALKGAQDDTARYLYAVLQQWRFQRMPETVATTPSPVGLVVDWTDGYWISGGTSIMRTPLDGATAGVQVVGGLSQATDIAVDATYVYWTDRGTGTVARAPKGGGPITTLASGQSQPIKVAVDTSTVYWINAGSNRLAKVPKSGGNVTLLSSVGPQAFTDLAARGGSVYWTAYSSESGLVGVHAANGAQKTLLKVQGAHYNSIALDGTNTYFTDEASGLVWKVQLSTGLPFPIAVAQSQPNGIFTDGARVYWANHGDGTTYAALTSGGPAVMLADAQSSPTSLAANERGIYWLDTAANASAIERLGPLPYSPEPYLVAGAASGSTDLVVDGSTLYWVMGKGNIIRQGTGRTNILSGQGDIRSLLLDGSTLYWVDAALGTVMSMPTSGGTPTTLAAGQATPIRLTMDASRLYWINAGDGTVMMMPRAGGAPAALSSGEIGLRDIAADPTRGWVYFSSFDGSFGHIKLWLGNGAPSHVVLSPGADPSTLAVDPNHYYWTDVNHGTVSQASATGLGIVTLATGQGQPGRLASDGTHVYWVDRANGTVWMAPVGGGSLVDIAPSFQDHPYGIAIGADTLYWTTSGSATTSGTVMGVSLF